MTTLDHWLPVLAADPTDAALLAYADWCHDEYGWTAYPEFVRVSIQDAGMCHDVDFNGCCGDDCQRCQTQSLMWGLLAAHGRAWTPRIAWPFASVNCVRCNGTGTMSCSKCSGEGCSVYGIAANGPCMAGDPCGHCHDGRTPDPRAWSRGVLTELRVPTLVEFVGGECPTCRNWHQSNGGHSSLCPGTATPGLAAALLAACPAVRSVWVADREPYQNAFSSWMWSCVGVDETDIRIPLACRIGEEPLTLVAEDETKTNDSLTWVGFPTAELANLALATALARYGRVQAGLEKPE